MAFDWWKYIDVAVALQNIKSEEAIRSGISRTYYAVFGKTRILCLNSNILKKHEMKGRSAHQTIIDKLKLSDEKELAKIGQYMETLRERRNDADYEADNKEVAKE